MYGLCRMGVVKVVKNLKHTFNPMILKKNSCSLDYDSCLWAHFYVKWSALSSSHKARRSSMIWVFIKDWDEKSLSIRKEMPHRSLFCCRCLNTWSKMALQPCSTAFVFAIIVDWFFTLCCVELSVWFPFAISIAQGIYGLQDTCCMLYILNHRLELNCCHIGIALYPAKFSSHKMDRIVISVLSCSKNLAWFPAVTGSWLKICENCKYSIISTFWIGSKNNFSIPIFSSFTQIYLLAATHKLVSSSLQ